MSIDVSIEYLEELTEDDIGTQKELIKLYRDSADKVIKQLEDVVSDDESEWKEFAHELKGASLSLGFNQLAEICSNAQLADNLTESDKVEIIAKIKAHIAEINKITNHLT